MEIGDVVEKGDLLAEIDPAVYRAKVDAAQAQLLHLEAQLAERQAQRKLAEQKAQRQANMMRENATTAEAVQTAEAELAVGQGADQRAQGADPADALDAARRPGEPRLHQDPRADGRHRGHADRQGRARR